jgi:hypothetical protein
MIALSRSDAHAAETASVSWGDAGPAATDYLFTSLNKTRKSQPGLVRLGVGRYHDPRAVDALIV